MMGTKKESDGLPALVSDELKGLGLKDFLENMRERYQEKVDIAEQAKKTATEVHEKIAPGGKASPEQMWLPFAPMPTDMCRVSPFFPLNKNQLRDRPFIRGMVITKSSWGQIVYSGPKLSTYEEDVLMAILAIIDGAKKKLETEVEGKTTYTYKGPLLPILRLMNLTLPRQKPMGFSGNPAQWQG